MRPRRILIVDDNSDGATTLAQIMIDEGHVVQTVNDGASALIAARSFRPDFVFLDLGMPGLDGFQVARTLKAELAEVQIITITGHASEEYRGRAYDAGANLHLIKPVDLQILKSLLGRGR